MNDKGAVERLKDAIYSRVRSPRVDAEARTSFSPPHEKSEYDHTSSEVPADTQTPINNNPRRNSFTASHYFLFGSLLFFVVAIAAAAWIMLGGFNVISSQNIELSVIAPPLIDSGKSTTVQFVINNKTETPLVAVDIVIDYPDGTRDGADPTRAITHDRISVGNLPSGAQIQKTSSAIFFGSEGAQEKVQATIEYQLAGSNAIFTKQADASIIIGSSPLSITIKAPQEAIAGQTFDISVTATANATNPISDVAVEVQYPFGFTVQNVTPSAGTGNTLWRFGTLKPGESRTIKISGVLAGEDGDARVFRVISGSESDSTNIHVSTPVVSSPYTMTIRRPFIASAVVIGGKSGVSFSAPLGSSIDGSIVWKNNLNETVTNMKMVVSIIGDVNPSSVQVPNGFYNSSKRQMIWDQQNNKDFISVAPGASGSMPFSFSSMAPSGLVSLNPHIDLSLSLSAVRGGTGGKTQTEVSAAGSATILMASSVALSAYGLHFSGPFTNSGPMPPKTDQATSYTVMWTLTNSSNTLANSRVRTTLPQNVEFISASGGAESISYESSTRTVSWDAGNLRAGVGYSLPIRTASFQVAITPSVTQLGQSAPLTGVTHFTADDRYATAVIDVDANPVTTRLDKDKGFTNGMDLVKQ